MLVFLTVDKQIDFFCPPLCCPFLFTSCYIQLLQGSGNGGERSWREIKGLTWVEQCDLALDLAHSGDQLWGLSLTWSIIELLREVLLGVSKYVPLKTASGFLSATGPPGVHLLQHHRICKSSWAGLSLSFLVYKNLLKWKLKKKSSILWASIQLPFNLSAAWLLGWVSFKTTPGELLQTHQCLDQKKHTALSYTQ